MTDRSQGAYYSKKLSGERLRRCYEVAPARARQYLEAEIRHAVEHLRPEDRVLELGCGHGRVARRLASAARRVVGIDTAYESLTLARKLARSGEACEYLCMDAVALAFAAGSFDAVLCLQNGICAFGVDQASLLGETLRVTREGGLVLFSSYSDKFWPHRLAWFEAQAAEGLIGPVDRTVSGNGVIVCKDGFRAGRMTPGDFHRLTSRMGVNADVAEVDESSVFCEIVKGAG